MNILVHACCAPCSIMPTTLLRQQQHDITVFFANSNITGRAEYAKRLDELLKYAGEQGFNVIEGAYRPDLWEQGVAPIGEAIKDYSWALGSKHVGDGELPAVKTVAELLDDERRRQRCRACYRMRLEEAAQAAVQGGFDALSTTLAVSPYQFSDVIREELEGACSKAGITPHFEDYRPYYDDATRISRERGMYRQSYCGCRFSIAEAQATRAFIKQKRAEAKTARAAQEEAQQAAERAKREQRTAEKRAYAEKQARKRAVLKSLRNSERR